MTGSIPHAVVLFGWGFTGGFAMAVVMFALPLMTHLVRAGSLVYHDRIRRHAILGGIALLGMVGGIVALTLPDTVSRGHAILAGIASQAIIKGIVRAGVEATAPPFDYY